MSRYSIVENLSEVTGEQSVSDTVKTIKSEKYAHIISKIRNNKSIKEAQNLKKNLPGFCPSGLFKDKRKQEYLIQYTGHIILDVDNIPDSLIESVFKNVTSDPHTHLCFHSPGGKGLKIISVVDTDKENHLSAYSRVADYYEKVHNIKIDPSGKDIARLCFFSYDPKCYYNKDSKTFRVLEHVQKQNMSKNESISEYQTLFEKCISNTNQKLSFEVGNRNNFIHFLANNCNRAGIPEKIASELILQENLNLPDHEIKTCIKSAYKNIDEFAKFAKFANLQSDDEDPLVKTPKISKDIIQSLPDIIKSGAGCFQDERERDVFIFGALSILSGCLPKVNGKYDGKIVYPNLFMFIVAPAANGKGAMVYAKKLATKYHKSLKEQSENEKFLYEAAKKEYDRQMIKGSKSDEMSEAPEKPHYIILFVPANTSYARLIWHLQQNNGCGILCETEADTMGNVLKQEWGSYSDLLRKAYHHEQVSFSRKTNNEFIEIDEPKLSVLLSGTPNQVTGLISSSEDGLFSRVNFYVFRAEQKWRDVSPKGNKINMSEYFEKLSQKVLELSDFLKKYRTEIELTNSQWEKLNHFCSNLLDEVVHFISEEASSVVKRLGLSIFRISMIFTALRKFENGDLETVNICNDEDFNSAISLGKIFIDHALLMFQNLPKQNASQGSFKNNNLKKELFNILPNSFRRKNAIQQGIKLGLKERTIDGFLRKLQPDYLVSKQPGYYEKVIDIVDSQ